MPFKRSWWILYKVSDIRSVAILKLIYLHTKASNSYRSLEDSDRFLMLCDFQGYCINHLLHGRKFSHGFHRDRQIERNPLLNINEWNIYFFKFAIPIVDWLRIDFLYFKSKMSLVFEVLDFPSCFFVRVNILLLIYISRVDNNVKCELFLCFSTECICWKHRYLKLMSKSNVFFRRSFISFNAAFHTAILIFCLS